MTFHAAFPSTTRRAATAARPARIVPLSASRSAVFFDAEQPTLHGRQRLSASLDGHSIDGPVAVTNLTLINGGARHVFLMSQPAEELCRHTLTLSGSSSAIVLAAINPFALQSPLTDPTALLAGLDRAGSLRLLKLLVTTGASLFGNGEIGAFGALVEQLVERLGEHVPLAARSPVGRRAWVLSWHLPVGLELPPLGAVTLLANGRTQRVTEFITAEEVVDGRRLLHFLVSRPLPKDAEFLALGETLLCLGMTGDVTPRPLAGWLAKRGAEVRAVAIAFVERLAAEQADVAILKAELACPRAAEPVAKVLYLSQSPAGLLYMIGVDDPRGLLSAVRLQMQRAHFDIPCDRLEWHSRHGAVVVGLAAAFTRCAGAATIAPLYLSGRLGVATLATASLANDLLPDVFRGLPLDVAAVPLARSLPATMGARPVWRHRLTEFGQILPAPGIAVVVAAGSAPEYLYAVVASVIAEAGGRAVEIVVHHRDGPATRMVRDAAEVLSAVHRVGLRVVSVAPQSLPSECLRAALKSVRAQKTVALGPGTLPGRRGWLSLWRRRIMAGSASRAVTAEARHPAAGDARGYIVGLDHAAMTRLLSCGPILPGVLGDIRATTGLAVVGVKGDGFATYEDCVPDDLARAVEVRVVSRIAEARHV